VRRLREEIVQDLLDRTLDSGARQLRHESLYERVEVVGGPHGEYAVAPYMPDARIAEIAQLLYDPTGVFCGEDDQPEIRYSQCLEDDVVDVLITEAVAAGDEDALVTDDLRLELAE
jgi:hypothetical protein